VEIVGTGILIWYLIVPKTQRDGVLYKYVDSSYLVIASDQRERACTPRFTVSARRCGNLSLSLRDCFVISCLPQAGIPRKDILFNAFLLVPSFNSMLLHSVNEGRPGDAEHFCGLQFIPFFCAQCLKNVMLLDFI
jgi:hypothetical protein